jgi:hypothetical protein
MGWLLGSLANTSSESAWWLLGRLEGCLVYLCSALFCSCGQAVLFITGGVTLTFIELGSITMI